MIVASFFDIHSHKMPTKREEKAEEFRKVTKQFLLEHLEEDELDLSMCNLSRVPVKELVSAFGHSNIIHWFSSPACILYFLPNCSCHPALEHLESIKIVFDTSRNFCNNCYVTTGSVCTKFND